MNRSILIVICDFLLVSLLAFSTVDINKLPQANASRPLKLEMATNAPANGRQDLGDVMRLALDEERKNRDVLVGELSRARETVGQRDQQIQLFQSQLVSNGERTAQLQMQQTNLMREFSVAQSNIENLNQQLRATTVESVISKEQRAAMEAEARKQSEKASLLEKQLAQLQNSNQLVLSEREALANQLQMSEAANRSAIAQMSQMQEEVDAQRQQNAQLAQGVQALASKSSELAQEIRQSQPLAPNELFDRLSTNRVLASFSGVKSGFFGNDSTHTKQTQTVLVSDGTNTVALCHVQDTPLTLWNPGANWEELSGTLAYGAIVIPMQTLSFYWGDPRIVLIPLTEGQAHSFTGKIYRLARDPYKFQDAVVVGTRENYYGECRFQIDLTTPQYLKMDHNSLKGLFGKFNPSSGDLVFSKMGEFLGVMANNNYCALIRNFAPAATLRYGPGGRNQPTAQTLADLYTIVSTLPFKLQ
ncbi:MAG: hypothetical protein ABSG59_05180 [Verrucomicrobiota bacterium]|jgi:hypothetical protein